MLERVWSKRSFCGNGPGSSGSSLVRPAKLRCWGPPGGSAGKTAPAMSGLQGDAGSTPGPEGPLEKDTATHSRILVWRSPWIEEPGGLQSRGLQRVGRCWSDLARTRAVQKCWPSNSTAKGNITLRNSQSYTCKTHKKRAQAASETTTKELQTVKCPLKSGWMTSGTFTH